MVVCVVHAGGKGERLLPLTLTVPKPLVEIGIEKKPLIYWSMLPSISYGIKKFVITTNYLSEKIEEYFKRDEWKGFEIIIYREKEKLGSAGATKYCIEEGIIDKKETVVMQNASDITRNFIRELLKYHKKQEEKGFELTIVCAERCVIPSSKVEYDVKTGKALSLKRKPEHVWSKGNASHVGTFVFSPKGLEKFKNVKIPSNPEDSVVQDLIKEGRACVYVTDVWIPIKYYSDVEEANKIDLRKFILGKQG
ncbi:MAG: sugar phosphate nucleotidyltransferase [Candidatus Aenigmarchaeota archaeon]|nr:sugar phosphate nucleotidyltransferase [Candidatus Aenigmarchaeota archaeon]